MNAIMHGNTQRYTWHHACSGGNSSKANVLTNSIGHTKHAQIKQRRTASVNERAASVPPQSGCVQPNEDGSESISMYCGIILCESNIDGCEQLEVQIYWQLKGIFLMTSLVGCGRAPVTLATAVSFVARSVNLVSKGQERNRVVKRGTVLCCQHVSL
jgi:hypothetical protein